MLSINVLTQFDFYPTLDSTPGLALVCFSSINCGSCQYLLLVLQQLQISDPQLSIFKVDAQQDQALVSEYEVFHLPSMFLFVDGEYHAPINCEASVDAIKSAIEGCLRLPAEEAP